MSVVPFLVVMSLALAALSVGLFVFSARNRDHEHADRLSLLPLEDDLAQEAASSTLRSSFEDTPDD
ncbi:MAG: cytochrome oxidase [Planctomycetota bacterium]|nr:cytochrome oxidase [Planctomycetota bacterium]MDA0932458.1 cytochrome oxidase [Planctomycetota bacterium]